MVSQVGRNVWGVESSIEGSMYDKRITTYGSDRILPYGVCKDIDSRPGRTAYGPMPPKIVISYHTESGHSCGAFVG